MYKTWIKVLTLFVLLLSNTLSFAQPCSEARIATEATAAADMPDCHQVASNEQISHAQTLCNIQSLAEKGLSEGTLQTLELPDLPQAIMHAPQQWGEHTSSKGAKLVLAADSIDIHAPPTYLTTQRFRI